MNLLLLVRAARFVPGLAVLLAAAGGLWGCSSSAPTRPTLTEEQLRVRSAEDAELSRETYRAIVSRMIEHAAHKTETVSAPTCVNILAMSGGGDFGAFGAGFLLGWGAAPDVAERRPDFDVVTGVSTGALLAPFAFVGTDETLKVAEEFYRNPKDDWIRDRGIWSFLPGNRSLMTITGLERDIRLAIGPELIGKMAEQSRKGKVLIISATDLDLGRQKFWDVGATAETAVTTGNMDPVQRIMFASSAIPAAFPPVEIGESLYADGGVTANVFLRLDPRSADAMLSRWQADHADKPFPKVRFWVIVNNQLSQTPKTIQANWPSVMAPSLATAIRSATIAEVRWLAAQVDYVNSAYKTDVEVRVVAIPDEWRPPVQGSFKKETMGSLADLGRTMGADPKSWTVWASPARPGAALPGNHESVQATAQAPSSERP